MSYGGDSKGCVDIQAFDLHGTLENVDGDKELFQGLVAAFLEELPLWMDEITRGYEAGDSQTIERAAHSIKGSAGNFGAAHAAEAAYRLELLGKNGKLNEMGPAIGALKETAATLSAALQKAVEAL